MGHATSPPFTPALRGSLLRGDRRALRRGGALRSIGGEFTRRDGPIRALVAIAALFAAAACEGEAGGADCHPDEERPTCAPLYEPTFDQLFARTLKPTCAANGGSCHAAEGRQGGLVLDDPETAFAGLVEGGRVTAGAPACSLLMERLDAPAGPQAMPPGAPLSEAERCAFRLWIADGARR